MSHIIRYEYCLHNNAPSTMQRKCVGKCELPGLIPTFYRIVNHFFLTRRRFCRMLLRNRRCEPVRSCLYARLAVARVFNWTIDGRWSRTWCLRGQWRAVVLGLMLRWRVGGGQRAPCTVYCTFDFDKCLVKWGASCPVEGAVVWKNRQTVSRNKWEMEMCWSKAATSPAPPGWAAGCALSTHKKSYNINNQHTHTCC